MAIFEVKFVLIQSVILILHLRRGLFIQCAPLGDASAVTAIPNQLNQTNNAQNSLLKPLKLAPAAEEDLKSVVNLTQNVTGSENREKRNEHDALMDIEEKDMMIDEQIIALGQTVVKLKNFVPEISPENVSKAPQDLEALKELVKLDPSKEKHKHHGAVAVEGGAGVIEDGNDFEIEKNAEKSENFDEANSDQEGNVSESTDDDDGAEQEATAVPQLYGSASLLRSEPNMDEPEFKSGAEAEVKPKLQSDQESLNQLLRPDGETESDADEDNEEATAIPQLYGAGTLARPIQNFDLDGRALSDEEDDGFVKDDVINLKDHVETKVLEVEVVTDPFDCESTRGPLRHLGEGTKFFADSRRLYNFREAREICSKYSLVIAEIEELADHRTISNFMIGSNFHVKSRSGGRFFIGLNDIKTEGLFQHANGNNVTYQDFLASQPDDKHESEDCVTITREFEDGPAGAADYDCNKTAHVLCMFQVETQCYNDSRETKENQKHAKKHDLHLLVNATERAYFVSNYQATWKEAMKHCEAKQMKVFDMDAIVTMGFFRSILRWEKSFFRVKMPTVQYWTSGKFQKSHMTAPIIWHNKPELTASEERGVEKHNGSFSFSGIFHWSSQKKRDPGGPHGWRRDLCLSFGFDHDPEAIPFVRNTNCDLPSYFICYEEYPDNNDDEDKPETTMKPINPEDKPVFPDPENETETLELEQEIHLDPRSFNHSCATQDEKDDVAGRNGIGGNYHRWWDGFVVYIDPSFSSRQRKLINTAMDRLRKVVCIPFYLFRADQKPYGDYVHIRDSGDCYSVIGKEGGSQHMSLANFCLDVGTIMHEMIHALGFFHEQARQDRDKYVDIFWENIIPKQKFNFYWRRGLNTYGVPYNTKSIMHYRSWEFSRNGKSTILDKDGGRVGSLNLQDSDIQKLKKMYRCDEADEK